MSALAVDARCLARSEGAWAWATIRRVNPDGTVELEYDVKSMSIMPRWHGVTPTELSFDDLAAWAPIYDELRAGGAFDRAAFGRSMARLGSGASVEQLDEFWAGVVEELFQRGADATLDAEEAHRVHLSFGLGARSFETAPREFKLYWNQTRMGGRDPDELPRAITLADAFAALGLSADAADPAAEAALTAFTAAHAVRIPDSLRVLMTRAGALDAIQASHPCSPEPRPIARWHLARHGERHAIAIMDPHQGNHAWWAVFAAGDDDAEIWTAWPDGSSSGDSDDDDPPPPPPQFRSAPTVALFFWDLAQTGLAWYQSTQFEGGKPVRVTDVGLALDR